VLVAARGTPEPVGRFAPRGAPLATSALTW